MTQKQYTKLGVCTIILHGILALLIVAYFLLMLGGQETAKDSSGELVEVYRYSYAMFIMFIIGLGLAVPITMINIMYFMRHLRPGRGARIPVIISTCLFAPVAIFFLLTTVMVVAGAVQSNLKQLGQGPQDELKVPSQS